MPSYPSPFYIHDAELAAALDEREGPAYDLVGRIITGKKSMLSPPTLKAIHHFAARGEGAILEVGAYVGGATIAALHGSAHRNAKLVTIEQQVIYESHPVVPTSNSVRDLMRNVEELGVARETFTVIPGQCHASETVGNTFLALLGEQVGFLMLDNDGCVDRDIMIFLPLLADGCLLVIDDYDCPELKSATTRRVVDYLVERGILEPMALLPYSTWFGRMVRRPHEEDIVQIRQLWARHREEKQPYYVHWLSAVDAQLHDPRAPMMVRAPEIDIEGRAGYDCDPKPA